MGTQTYQPTGFDGAPAPGWGTATFAVPADSGQYAPTILYLERSRAAQSAAAGASLAAVVELQVLVQSIPAGATVEVDIVRPGDAVAGTWRTAIQAYTTVGLNTPLALSRWPGVRIRVKSGGTAGNAVVDVSWLG